MTVAEMQEVCTRLVTQVGLDPVQVWGLATTELLDLADQLDGAPITADDAFGIGVCLGAYFASDDDRRDDPEDTGPVPVSPATAGGQA